MGIKKLKDSFDLMYIEIADLEKNLDESTLNVKSQCKKFHEIFIELRQILKIKHETN